MSKTTGTETEITGAGTTLDYVTVTPYDTNDIAVNSNGTPKTA